MAWMEMDYPKHMKKKLMEDEMASGGLSQLKGLLLGRMGEEERLRDEP